MFKFSIISLLVISFTLSGCATTYNPATGRKELILITTPVEVSLGNMIAAKISNQFKISKDSQKIKRMTEIGKKIAGVSDRRDLKYKFAVIEDESLNAFASPGGYVYINSGLIEKATDDELACVIGHEVGHVAARHIAKKLQAQIGYDILMNIAARRVGVAELQKAASISYNLIMLGYSREDELLSDRLGAKYAYKAGYDPFAMITFLEKLEEAKDGEMGLVFLRSHPYASQRIKMLKREIPAIIEKADKKAAAVVQTQKKEHIKADPAITAKVSPLATDKTRPLKVMCPACKRIFSGKTKYCPYDGTVLQ